MKPIPYVNDKAQHVARWMESRLQEVNEAAGIIFVSVKAVPMDKGNSVVFEVRLGIDRKHEEDTALSVIKHVFREEISKGVLNINAAVFRGIRGAAINPGDEEARPVPS